MKKLLTTLIISFMVLFVGACSIPGKTMCCSNSVNHETSKQRTHLYNNQTEVKGLNSTNKYPNATVPASTGVYQDKNQMLYQNPDSGTESTGPR